MSESKYVTINDNYEYVTLLDEKTLGIANEYRVPVTGPAFAMGERVIHNIVMGHYYRLEV